MSKLYGFKFTSNNSYRSYKNGNRRILLDNEKSYLSYSILSESNNRYYIDEYYNGANHHFDITDKIEQFYNEIKDLEIEKWNFNTFTSDMEWFEPSDYWTLDIHINDISVTCKGYGAVPPNWNQFWKAFRRMCSNSKE